MNSINNIKSITTVNTSNGWAVRQSNDDGTELFIMPEIFETPYTLEHAKLEAEALKQHLGAGGTSYAKPLPAGVRLMS